MIDFRLPPDLHRFLLSGRQLQYTYALAEPGRVTLHRADTLRLEDFSISTLGKEYAKRDPNRGRRGRYLVPGANLVASCDGHSPDGILLWLPKEGSFGAWDCDHHDIWAFPEVTWSEIEADPLKYVNAQWYPETTEIEWLVPWPRHPFIADDQRGAVRC